MADENNKTYEKTDAIVSYDGIFKGMYDAGLGEMFQAGRKLLSTGNWTAGRGKFEEALSAAGNSPRDQKTLRLLIDELDRYERNNIEAVVNATETPVSWSAVAGRGIERIDESMFALPQGIFFLDVGRPGHAGYQRLVGRKLLSDYWIAFKIPELFCSLVKADMILGLFVDQRISDSNVTLFYHPLSKAEKLRVMKDIVADERGANAELIHPFPLLREPARLEAGSPPEGWIVDDAFDVMLGCGEERIRAYSIQFLIEAGVERPILYDPACSTGVFLSTLQKAMPGSYTIGQDLSQQMANFAKQRVDEAHCANAIDPKIKLGTADACYVRFLNSEVVKTSEAEELFQALLPTVKPGGYIITFGHTPVLLSSANFKRNRDFRLCRSLGVAVDGTGIFQYYVMQRNK